MTFIVATLLGVLAIQAAVIAALLRQRRALRQSEAFFRHLADGAPMIMWTTRPDTTLDYLNNTVLSSRECRCKSCSETVG